MGDVSPRTYYDRQLRVPGWGHQGQETLGRSTVLVVGVGGLGCPVLGALARAGVGRLVFCDPDRVEASNLPRQTLFTPADVGRPKVEAAAQALRSAQPWVELVPNAVRVDRTNVRALVEDADLVIDGTDTFEAKFLIHDACRSAGKPLVLASLYQWEAQVTVFPFRPGQPGCWRCLYPEAPEDGCVGVCADVGVAGALAGLAGNAQALAGLRLLLGLEGPKGCSSWIYDAADPTPRRLRWKPDPGCACRRGAGDWAWLENGETNGDRAHQAGWADLGPGDRQTIIDVRETPEILAGEWEFFRSAGSEVLHRPWSQWGQSSPVWETGRTYLLVCARGSRSLAALRTVAPAVRARSLAGGVAELYASGRITGAPSTLP